MAREIGDNILEVNNLSVSYNGTSQSVNDISFSVKKGSIVAIVGESGSGKSTTIRAILGLLGGDGKVTSGDITYEGKSLVNMKESELCHIRGREIAMIFQDAAGSLDPRKKIGYQYVEAIRTHLNMTKDEARDEAVSMLTKLSFADPERVLNSYPFELSGGMLQRISIAIAMSLKTKILLADEPTSALDVTIAAQVVDVMKKVNEQLGTTIIFVTHNLSIASYLADEIIVMQNSKIVEMGTKAQVIETPSSEYTRKLLMAAPNIEF